MHLRVDPRQQRLELFDPSFKQLLNTITTSSPPPELGGGLIDETRVTISRREIVWEQTMFRPQFQRTRHRIDRASLHYRIDETIQIALGAETAEQVRSGSCRRMQPTPTR